MEIGDVVSYETEVGVVTGVMPTSCELKLSDTRVVRNAPLSEITLLASAREMCAQFELGVTTLC